MLKKLLLADDSLTIQKVVGIVFANLDYQLLIADDGDDALALARKEFPDLVIADIGMPGKDGFELCREIKNDVNLGAVPVLLLPGAFENFDENKAVLAGADGWLTKPFESQTLISKVEELLASASEIVTDVPASTVEDTPELIVPDEVASFEDPEPTAVEETISFETPEPAAVEEIISFETPEPIAVEDTISFEIPDSTPIEEPAVFDIPAPPVVEENLSFETPVLEEPAVAGDDIWDAVTFEEEDLQPAVQELEPVVQELEPVVEELEPVVEELEPVVEELEPVVEELEPVVEELEPVVEELEPVVEELEPVVEELEPVVESAELSVGEGPDDEILELGVDDILELEDDAIIEEVLEETTDFTSDQVAQEDETTEDIFDFSAPAPIVELESVTAAPIVYDLSDEVDEVDEVVSTTIETAAQVDVAVVEEQLATLSESDLEEVVKKVAGPIIEKLAGQLLEQVIWEVVPDLAESMIKDEIRKIKEGSS